MGVCAGAGDGEQMGIWRAYGEVLVLLRFLLREQRNPGMDARIRRHRAWTRVAADAWLFETFRAKTLEELKFRSPHAKCPSVLHPLPRHIPPRIFPM